MNFKPLELLVKNIQRQRGHDWDKRKRKLMRIINIHERVSLNGTHSLSPSVSPSKWTSYSHSAHNTLLLLLLSHSTLPLCVTSTVHRCRNEGVECNAICERVVEFWRAHGFFVFRSNLCVLFSIVGFDFSRSSLECLDDFGYNLRLFWFVYCSILFSLSVILFFLFLAVLVAMSKISGQADMYRKSKLLRSRITYIWSKFV